VAQVVTPLVATVSDEGAALAEASAARPQPLRLARVEPTPAREQAREQRTEGRAERLLQRGQVRSSTHA